MAIPTAVFQSFSAAGDEWNASLRNPRATRVANRYDEVIPLIREADAAAKNGAWVALAVSYDAAPAFDRALRARRTADCPLAWCAIFDERSLPESAGAPARISPVAASPAISREEYFAAIARIRSYIAAGDTYQVNFTYPLTLSFEGDSLDFFRAAGASQAAGYSAYLDIGNHRLLSFSPELFFKLKGGVITTRPMKGTAPRGRWGAEDDERAAALAASTKDLAENVMIVDLLRSDLGRIAEVGSVEVTELFAIERISRVLQMTSTVTAKVRDGTTLAGIFTGLFPCGSVTGAPKPRTMAIIEELERFPRGMYTGAIGLLSPGGDAVFNVAIRTLVAGPRGRSGTFGVGGGITWDSTAEGEYAETVLKASFLGVTREEFDLLETLALLDGRYTLLDRHLSRMKASARYFAFAWSEDRAREALDEITSEHPNGPWRVRLLSSRAGKIRTESVALPPPRETPLIVKLATSPIDDRDALIYHKTTSRARYDQELAANQPCDDVIFWNARDEVTESSIANVVLRLDGTDFTPPREAGLLAGTLRDELIERGELFERTIRVDELRKAGAFFLINSVRGWMPARLDQARVAGGGNYICCGSAPPLPTR